MQSAVKDKKDAHKVMEEPAIQVDEPQFYPLRPHSQEVNKPKCML